MVSCHLHQILQVAVCYKPQPEQAATHLQFLILISQLVTVVLGKVLDVEAIDAENERDGEAVELEEPEIAHNRTSVLPKVFLNRSVKPVGKWFFGILVAARTGSLVFVRFAGHRALLVEEGEVEIRGVFIGLVDDLR